MFSIIYRNFYAQWHGDPFTRIWLFQLTFTSASALYQFAVLGLRLYLPLGVARPEMAAIWSPEQKFRIWFEIEAHAADAQAELGVIPKDAARTVWDKARMPSSTWPASTPSKRK
jgi:hypothetical protein